ncbi:MAG TPA: cytochrome c family protein [Stellaceae bacterium]|nr:cytochrome c family protein [Stellaceae bacterium]
MRAMMTAVFASALLSVAAPTGVALARPPAPDQAINPLRLYVADAARGQGIFQGRCAVCHTVAAGGPNKIGPALHGLFGRKAGSLPDYNYSSAMRTSGVVWGAQTLNAYLTNPHRYIPGDKMPFPGLPSQQDRSDVIAYLDSATR